MMRKLKEYKAGGLLIPVLFILTAVFTFILVMNKAGLPPDIPDSLREEYIYGYAYKSVWNKSGQVIFITEDGDRVLLYCDRQEDSIMERINTGTYICLRTSNTSVSLPASSANFGGFDHKQYLAGRKVNYTAYTNKGSIEILSDEEIRSAKENVVFDISMLFKLKACSIHFSAKIRESIYDALSYSLGPENASAAMAILTGDSEGISDESMQKYRNAGIAHIMAVSGMHIGFVQNLTMKAFSRRKISYSSRRVLCILCLVIFAGAADYSASVTRALLQSVYFLVGGILRRPCKSQNALLLAASVQLLMNPYILYNSGFVLSYAAAASIVIIRPVLSKHIFFFGKIPDAISAGFSVNIGTTPIMIQYFNSISPIGILATLFASKLAYMICLSGFLIWLLHFVPFGIYISKIPAYIISACVFGLDKVSSLSSGIPPPLGPLRVPSLPVYAMILYYGAVFIILMMFNKKCAAYMKKHTVKFTLAAAALIIFVSVFLHIRNDRIEVVFFDVGQGFSALIKTGDMCGLIDSGDGKTDISSLLYKQGVGTLDFVLITHGHADHAGGIYDIMNEHTINCLILPDNPYDETVNTLDAAARQKGMDVVRIRGTEKYSFSDMDVVFYANQDFMTSGESSDINNSSVVMYACGKHGSMLFTGDIEKESESDLIYKNYVSDVDLLAVAHHGSDTSTEAKNVSIISPEYAIISVGRNNSYGHPSARVLETLEEAGAKLRRTDACGAVIITMRKGILYPWQKLQI